MYEIAFQDYWSQGPEEPKLVDFGDSKIASMAMASTLPLPDQQQNAKVWTFIFVDSCG